MFYDILYGSSYSQLILTAIADGPVTYSVFCFLKEFYCTEKSVKYTRLQNCSLNQFPIVVTRRVSDWVSTVLGSYKCSREKEDQKKNTAAVE